MEGEQKLSFVYSMLMVSILVLSFLIASRFVDLGEGAYEDFVTGLSANAVVITYLFFILLLSAVTVGFSFMLTTTWSRLRKRSKGIASRCSAV